MLPNWMPYGLEMTVPSPSPDFKTVSKYSEDVAPANVAVTDLSVFNKNVQVDCVPEQAPDHPLNVPPCDVAVRVIKVPES